MFLHRQAFWTGDTLGVQYTRASKDEIGSQGITTVAAAQATAFNCSTLNSQQPQ